MEDRSGTNLTEVAADSVSLWSSTSKSWVDVRDIFVEKAQITSPVEVIVPVMDEIDTLGTDWLQRMEPPKMTPFQFGPTPFKTHISGKTASDPFFSKMRMAHPEIDTLTSLFVGCCTYI